MLIAEVVEITGPEGLTDHALLQQNEAVADYVTRNEGGRLVQILESRGQRAELRGQIDRWTVCRRAALHDRRGSDGGGRPYPRDR